MVIIQIKNNFYNKQAYILFYNEYLYDISEKNINRKKKLAEVKKKLLINILTDMVIIQIKKKY